MTAGVLAPCRAATIAKFTLSGTQTIDGVLISTGDRVLVKNQMADTVQRGVGCALREVVDG